MLHVDPVALAHRQLARDREAAKGLFAHKLARMSASPFAFLRGTAPMFYELLRESPALAEGPPGTGWVTGDLHIENFGAYRPRSPAEDGARRGHPMPLAMFDLNDFDDAFVGPWRIDVLRLLVSLLLAARDLDVRGPRAVALCEAFLAAYVPHACGKARVPPVPASVARLVREVQARSRQDLLAERTRVVRGKRAFVRDEHFRNISAAAATRARAAFAKYARRIAKRTGIDADAFHVLDVAQRVAGTGSLGMLRVGVLVRGKGGPDGAWIFDMKEQGAPSGALVFGEPELRGAKRVVAAARACLPHPPRMLGTTKLEGRSMLVRRLTPQEDKLDPTEAHADELETLAAYLGALVGMAHRRGATRPPKRAWTKEERSALLDRAIVVAGFHETAYLAYFKAAAAAQRGA